MEESTIHILLYLAFCIGLIIASAIAHTNAPKWQAKLQIWGSIMHTLGILSILASLKNGPDSEAGILIIAGLVLVGFLLYIIGLLSYCVKTYTVNKANEQLEFLNYQLNDQIEIRSNQSQSPSETPQPQSDTIIESQ